VAKALGLRVVAEGVGDRAGVPTAGEYGCDEAQGLLPATPQTPAALADWLAQHAHARPHVPTQAAA
jgi:EAL domain-containing protein (putative c-di-GMP-specific phosphodiesterase class I)